jgi:hypothetical protein
MLQGSLLPTFADYNLLGCDIVYYGGEVPVFMGNLRLLQSIRPEDRTRGSADLLTLTHRSTVHDIAEEWYFVLKHASLEVSAAM